MAAKSPASDVFATASATAAEALDQLTRVARDLADQASQRASEAPRAVREHPGVALGGAVAVGLLAGLLLGRR